MEMTDKELKKRYDYFRSPVKDENLIHRAEWDKMTPEERKKMTNPTGI